MTSRGQCPRGGGGVLVNAGARERFFSWGGGGQTC